MILRRIIYLVLICLKIHFVEHKILFCAKTKHVVEHSLLKMVFSPDVSFHWCVSSRHERSVNVEFLREK